MVDASTGIDGASTEDTLLRFLERYDKSPKAITVNFRKLVPWMTMGERATHHVHPYPAKLLPQIPTFFLANQVLSAPGDIVLDPFCGSGTVLLESVLHGRHALGVDANPLARLIATTKIAELSVELLRRQCVTLLQCARRYRRAQIPDVVNLEYWFYPHIIDQLARLRRALDTIEDPDVADFFRVCLSVCVRRVSLADPRLSVPVRLRHNQYPTGHPFHESTNARLRKLHHKDVFAEYEAIVASNIARVAELVRLRSDGTTASIISTDARKISECIDSPTRLADSSVDFVVTSPPYVGAQKYVRASSLSIGWLSLANGNTLRQLEDQNIGREHFTTGGKFVVPKTGISDADRRLQHIEAINPLRALIAATYLVEMEEALRETTRVLKPGGHLVLVAANNRVCGKDFYTQRYLQSILERLGLVVRLRVVDAIRSRGLMTRRNSTASVIAREWAFVFQKPSAENEPCQS